MELSRRQFLKGTAILTASCLVNDFTLLFPKEAIPKKFLSFGNFRAVCMYDIVNDLEMVRYDILASRTQLHVACKISLNDQKNFIKKYHKPMIKTLKNEIRQRRIKQKDLLELKYPPGYTHPNWFQEIINTRGV